MPGTDQRLTSDADVRRVHGDNGDWWNETSKWYGKDEVDQEIEFFRGGGSYLFDSERKLLGDLGPWCRQAIHLQCSHGRDSLSLLNEGAAKVVGVDISEELLAYARRKSEALGANVKWVQSDILSVPHDLDGSADLVYTGKGALCWMMDIDKWADVIVRLLKPKGLFFIHEVHPVDWVWDMSADAYLLDEKYGDYFSTICRNKCFSRETQSTPQFRQWTLADTVNSLIKAGLTIEGLYEYPEPFWAQFPSIPDDTIRKMPHTFTIMARKR